SLLWLVSATSPMTQFGLLLLSDWLIVQRYLLFPWPNNFLPSTSRMMKTLLGTSGMLWEAKQIGTSLEVLGRKTMSTNSAYWKRCSVSWRRSEMLRRLLGRP
ncbi:hypothetical protein FOZ62_021797, partial [Perkinsus olseni]